MDGAIGYQTKYIERRAYYNTAEKTINGSTDNA